MSERLLEYLLNEASSGITDKLSFQLMEALLYRVELNLLTGRMENTLVILQVSMSEISGSVFISEHGVVSEMSVLH